MDFQSLTRKELQTLCKKNKIPANITNVAMADALQALEHVEGLEEFLSHPKTDPQNFTEEAGIGSPDVPRTSTRRKPMKEELEPEPESSQPMTRTRRGTRRGVAEEEVDQEKNEVHKTPAAPSSRRRVPPLSTRQKTEALKDETSAQRVYSTRRSVRLLEKTMEKLTLTEDRKIQPLKIEELSKEMENGSEKYDSPSEEGASVQTLSETSSERTEDLNVSADLKSNGSADIQMELKNEVQENPLSHVQEVEDSKSKSELMDEAHKDRSGDLPMCSVEKSDETIDVEDETADEKELNNVSPNKFSYEAQDSDKDLGTDDSLAATEIKSSVGQEENEFSSIPLNLSSSSVVKENIKDEESESVMIMNVERVDQDRGKEGSKSEFTAAFESNTIPRSPADHCYILTSIGSDWPVTEDDCHGQFDSDSESTTAEEESTDGSTEVESVDGDDNHYIFINNGSEKNVTEGVNHGKLNFESESSDESSEEETEDSVVSDEDSSHHSEDISDDEVESEELVDIHVVEAEVAVISQSNLLLEENSSVKQQDMEKLSSSGALVDVCVSAEEFTAIPSLNKSPVPVNEMNPCNDLISPFANDQLSGLFPRPTLPKPSQSSSKRHPLIQKISDVLDENQEEEVVLTGEDEIKKNENVSDNSSMAKLYGGTSLRQLQKMLKHKLQIENNKKNGKDRIDNDKQVEKPRIALQTLPQNHVVEN